MTDAAMSGFFPCQRRERGIWQTCSILFERFSVSLSNMRRQLWLKNLARLDITPGSGTN